LAYAQGVNAFINSHPNRLPVEFRLLGHAHARPVSPAVDAGEDHRQACA
jgi:acyl-homoserine lactone acylase PvdQ